jgi:hypothetical protein
MTWLFNNEPGWYSLIACLTTSCHSSSGGKQAGRCRGCGFDS